MDSGENRGFTLLEALIALSILGILAALALPAYRDHLFRSARLEAGRELVEVATDLERYHARNGRYVDDARPLLAPATAGRRRSTRGGHYEIEVRACSGRALDVCFIAVARPRGGQARDVCGWFSLSSDGSREAEGDTVAVCWR